MAKLKVTAKLETPEFKAKEFLAAAKTLLRSEHKNAVAAWVETVARSIPTYTGTAKGTIAPVGRTVGAVVAAIANTTGKNTFTYGGKSYPLGFSAGENYQEHSLSVEETGNTLTYTFRFVETLPYVVWNSLYPAPAWMKLRKQTPWYAMHKGAIAFADYVKNELPKNLPAPYRFIRLKVVRVT